MNVATQQSEPELDDMAREVRATIRSEHARGKHIIAGWLEAGLHPIDELRHE